MVGLVKVNLIKCRKLLRLYGNKGVLLVEGIIMVEGIIVMVEIMVRIKIDL